MIRKLLNSVVMFGLMGCLTLAVRAETLSGAYPCHPSPAVRQALDELSDALPVPQKLTRQQRIERFRQLLQQYPDDPFVHRAYQDLFYIATEEEHQQVAEYYRTLMESHPENPLYLYLYGRVLVQEQSPEAMAYLQKALQIAPDFPWTHLALAFLYLSEEQKDKEKARQHIETLIALCPDSPESYAYLTQVGDPAVLRETARQMRRVLERQLNADNAPLYSTLWQVEFRSTPAPQHAQLREQVRKDLKRLRRLKLVRNGRWLWTLYEGYQMLGDERGLRWVEDQAQRYFPFVAPHIALRRWERLHPRPESTDREKWKSYFQSLLRATDEWIRRWPDEWSIWMRRFHAIRGLDDVPVDVALQTVDRLLEAVKTVNENVYIYPPIHLQVAELYVQRGVRLEQVPDLVAQGLEHAEAEAQRRLRVAYPKDVKTIQRSREIIQTNLENARWMGWSLQVEVYLKTQQTHRARETLVQMEAFLARHKPGEDTPDEKKRLYASWETQYWDQMARWAEAEGRKLDALAFYQHVLASRPGAKDEAKKDEAAQRAYRLWRELGGTDEGWQAWRTRPEAARPAPEAPEGRWVTVGKPLPDFELQDMQGKTWRLADLKGKVALINVWATWCGPCLLELPYVQKLHERLKDRSDMLVLTLNVDVNIGVVEPFLKKYGYTFPVLFAAAYVWDFLNGFVIPQTWVVDAAGVIRMEHVGGMEGDRWVEEAVQMMEKVRTPGGR